ncbi:hypothetical protein HJ590_17245 [Naumannella sp. ID2617S]|nr:hypothetical protein [Naumannella sp. ID2617S]
MSVTKKSGGTVVASKEIQQKLTKGQTQEVKADRFAKATEKPEELQCVTGATVKRG